MYVGSDLNTVSSWYGQQKGNNRKALGRTVVTLDGSEGQW